MQKRMLFAGFTAAKKTIIQNWFTPHMCGKTYWIRSLLQVVTCECATARVGGAMPSTIDAWQCFLVDIRDCIKEWPFCVLIVLPSLPPFWLDLEMLSICLLFCFVVFWMLCCVVCEKKKKKKRSLDSYRQVCLIRVGAKLCRTPALQDRSCLSLLWWISSLVFRHIRSAFLHCLFILCTAVDFLQGAFCLPVFLLTSWEQYHQ